jgi:hypothetical protein
VGFAAGLFAVRPGSEGAPVIAVLVVIAAVVAVYLVILDDIDRWRNRR